MIAGITMTRTKECKYSFMLEICQKNFCEGNKQHTRSQLYFHSHDRHCEKIKMLNHTNPHTRLNLTVRHYQSTDEHLPWGPFPIPEIDNPGRTLGEKKFGEGLCVLLIKSLLLSSISRPIEYQQLLQASTGFEPSSPLTSTLHLCKVSA